MTEAPSAGRTTGSLNEPYPKPADNVGQLILDRVAKSGPEEAFQAPTEDGGWRSYTWQQVFDEASEVAAGLVSIGVEPEQRVSIASNTRLDWIIADYAIMLAGAATTTIYPTTGAEDVGYILVDSHTRVLIAEDMEQAEKAEENKDNLADLQTIVLMDGDGNGDNILSWEELKAKGRELLAEKPDLIKDNVAAINGDSLATLIYTSGTTGKPKGVELTHSNWTYEGASMSALGVILPDDVQFLWLPLAHSFGKVLMCAHLQVGGVTAVDGRVPKIVENLPVIRPTVMAAVPRIFEKVNAGVMRQVKEDGGAKEKIFNWAFAVGTEAHEKEAAGEKVGGLLAMKVNLADKLVFSKIRERLGGRLRYMVSGSAALSSDINTWFQVAGLPILEGYGLTETSAGSVVNRPGAIKSGTVGQPLPGTEAKIAADGEILLRGPGVMRGYRNRPEANEEVFGVEEGWFATGDIGVIDEAGRIKITDRKKDLVKTSGGKYIAPGAIEAQFKAHCPLAGAVVVIANNRKFASALVALDPDAITQWATTKGLADTSVEAAAKNPEVRAEVQAAIDSLNGELNHWETIKQFQILPRELTVEGGELTPSLKVKRKVVEEEFAADVDAMYGG
ncbi:MAG: long-chain fatty acid--CoA ligase [Actinomycetia bacterium]|nr:long-chain fatty acid--CoA ligase [Actinomycetes bacterium]